jgi:hypothetical protein
VGTAFPFFVRKLCLQADCCYAHSFEEIDQIADNVIHTSAPSISPSPTSVDFSAVSPAALSAALQLINNRIIQESNVLPYLSEKNTDVSNLHKKQFSNIAQKLDSDYHQNILCPPRPILESPQTPALNDSQLSALLAMQIPSRPQESTQKVLPQLP